jgi:two-component system OmpR family sensor kinase
MFTLIEKWRPSLALVLGGALVGTLGLALLGLVALRYLGPEIGFLNAAAAIAIVIAVLTGVCGWLLVRLLLRPVRALSQYATQVRTGKMDRTAPPSHFGTSELRNLAGAVVDMADALKTREATIRSYSDHITHELKTPVSVIVAASEMLEEGANPDQGRILVAQIASAAHQMNDQLNSLRDMVQAREADYRGTTTLAAMDAALKADFPNVEIAIEGAQVALPLSTAGLGLVLDHMVDNAAKHGATQVRLRATSDGTLDISDNGTGLGDAEAAKIFEPLYTTRRDTDGTGMGLAIVRSVLNAHGAQIDSIPGPEGATFRIQFR